MRERRISRRHALKTAGAGVVYADTPEDGRRFRWDILTSAAAITSGGQLSAKASDGKQSFTCLAGTTNRSSLEVPPCVEYPMYRVQPEIAGLCCVTTAMDPQMSGFNTWRDRFQQPFGP
jgi:hypothetical protein